ncbi:MAG: carboxypeptidase-like regulatory domain-containing protein, partial [Acidobacteriota bacterium]|nr:carboxypeptidase-like regulatory domain-containing protein [Acidobacteriota bacterium]
MTLRRVCFSLASVILAGAAFGQDFRATVTGRVTDPTSSGVANAKITVHNRATGEDQVQNTSTEGDYTIPFLIPGVYSVSAEAAGFKRSVREPVEMHVNDKVTVNFAMEIGAVQDTLTVSDTAPLLDEATATRGGLIENLRVTELPLNGRNPFSLANLATGVVFAGNPQFTRPFDNGDNINFSINGGLRQTNSYLLDGVPDDAVTDADTARTRSVQNIAYIPTVDATQEFKIITNFYDAQYGRTGGGIVNVTTKSGANAFHGTGYEFLRRYQLDANSIQNNAAGRPRYGVDPVTKANLGGHTLDQYGTEITGPVFIPKLYNGKDKTFFAFGFENYNEAAPSPILNSVPSLAERNGDFSQSGVSIYDPATTRVNPAFDSTKPDSSSNPQYIRDQFPGNIIPANRFNTVGKNIVNAFPAPNVGGANAVFNNFIASPNLSEDHFRNYIGRVDQTFSEKERVFVRYAHNRRNQIDNGANGFTGIGRDAQDPLVRINDSAVFDSLTVLNPNTLFDARLGFTRFIQAAFRTSVSGFDATTLGFPASFSNSRFTQLPPRIEVDQYPTFGTRNPNQNTTNLFSFAPSVSYIHNIHSVKVGADLRDIRANVRGGSFLYGAGDFQFTRPFTQRLPAFSDSSSGNAIASLLLGDPSGGIIQNTPILAYRWGYYGFYFQDDIKVSRKLTLNVGVRYDIEGSPTERYDRMNRGFSAAPSPIAGAVRNANPSDCPACSNLIGGLQFVTGSNRQAFNTEYS